jgi:CheY-like chemotaxis protein
VLSVSDNGPGIAPEDMERIFEPFYTKKVMGRSGTGLGLTVVWNTVKENSGYIDVRTGAGGTRFDLYFPAVDGPAAGKTQASPDAALCRGDGESILVVDDEASQRELARESLRYLGYEARTVESGEAAVEYLKNGPADLVLLDMIMDPGMDGLETYAEILKFAPGQKAIIASGYADTDRVEAAYRLGASAFIPKPYTLEQLSQAIREALDPGQGRSTNG